MPGLCYIATIKPVTIERYIYKYNIILVGMADKQNKIREMLQCVRAYVCLKLIRKKKQTLC